MQVSAIRVVLVLVLFVGMATGAHISTVQLSTERVTLSTAEVTNINPVVVKTSALQIDSGTATGISITLKNDGSTSYDVDIHVALKGASTEETKSGTKTVPAKDTATKLIQFDQHVAFTDFYNVEVTVQEV